MMQGAWAAKEFVRSYLEQDMPPRMVAYRNLWNLDDSRAAAPTIYHNFEPASLLDGTDDYPVCYTVILTTRSMERVDYSHNLDPHYRVTYEARSYVWALDESEAMATEQRDHLVLVLREALLDHQCLEIADTMNREVKVDEGSFREEYSDLMQSRMGMWLSGGFLSYNITLNEIVTRRQVGTVEDIQIDARNQWAFLSEE